MKKNEKLVKVNLVDVLLDDNNSEPITIYVPEEGKTITFDQVAVLPRGEDELYCILKPITPIPGIGEREAVVFKVVEEDGDPRLEVEKSQETCNQIFDMYYDLIGNEIKICEKERIISVIRNDPDLQGVRDYETGMLVEYDKLDIHALSLGTELFAIIKEKPETSFSEASVWTVVGIETERPRLVWLEEEELELAIINMYLGRRERDGI